MINEHDNVLMNMWRGMRPMSIKNFFDTYLDFFFFFFFFNNNNNNNNKKLLIDGKNKDK
jgi:hypothetical protein